MRVVHGEAVAAVRRHKVRPFGYVGHNEGGGKAGQNRGGATGVSMCVVWRPRAGAWQNAIEALVGT